MFRTVDVGERIEAMEDMNLFLFWKEIQHYLPEERGEVLANGGYILEATLVYIPVADIYIKQDDIVKLIVVRIPSEHLLIESKLTFFVQLIFVTCGCYSRNYE